MKKESQAGVVSRVANGALAHSTHTSLDSAVMGSPRGSYEAGEEACTTLLGREETRNPVVRALG